MCDVKGGSKLRKKNKQEKSESGKAAMRPGLCYASTREALWLPFPSSHVAACHPVTKQEGK